MMIEGNQKEIEAMAEFHKGNRKEGRIEAAGGICEGVSGGI